MKRSCRCLDCYYRRLPFALMVLLFSLGSHKLVELVKAAPNGIPRVSALFARTSGMDTTIV